MSNRLWRLGGSAIAALAMIGLPMLTGKAQPAPAAAAQIDPSAHLYELNFKLQGSSGCAAAKCHGAPVGAAKGADYVNPSFTLWDAPAKPDAPADPHRGSFKTLRNPKSQAIATAMKIANPVAAVECLACHAINAPANVRDKDFQITEAVSCNGCHGPSGESLTDPKNKGWNAAHTVAKGWFAKTRETFAGNHEGMLKATGVYDTRPLVARSEQCVSCHLSISPKMIAAGHPQPTFEMHWFSAIYPNRHWTDPTDQYFGAKLWAAGQVASLEAAMKQLAKRADPASGATQQDISTAYTQAFAHYMVTAPLFAAGGATGDFNAVAKELTAAQKVLADPAKRDALKAAATNGAAAASKLTAGVEKWAPLKAFVLATTKTLLGQPAIGNLVVRV